MSSATREIVDRFLAALSGGAEPREIAALFAADARFSTEGDLRHVPWLGDRSGREEVAGFYQLLRDATVAESMEADHVVVDGDHAVIVGRLATRVKATGKTIRCSFAMVLEVSDGCIIRFRQFEDSFAVSEAMRPDG